MQLKWANVRCALYKKPAIPMNERILAGDMQEINACVSGYVYLSIVYVWIIQGKSTLKRKRFVC